MDIEDLERVERRIAALDRPRGVVDPESRIQRIENRDPDYMEDRTWRLENHEERLDRATGRDSTLLGPSPLVHALQGTRITWLPQPFSFTAPDAMRSALLEETWAGAGVWLRSSVANAIRGATSTSRSSGSLYGPLDGPGGFTSALERVAVAGSSSSWRPALMRWAEPVEVMSAMPWLETSPFVSELARLALVSVVDQLRLTFGLNWGEISTFLEGVYKIDQAGDEPDLISQPPLLWPAPPTQPSRSPQRAAPSRPQKYVAVEEIEAIVGTTVERVLKERKEPLPKRVFIEAGALLITHLISNELAYVISLVIH